MLLKTILFHQKSRKAPAWNFLLCGSYFNSLFQNIPLFFCPLIFKIFLKPQVRINIIAGENGVIYHPTSPSGSRSKIHVSLKPFEALQYLSKGICWIFSQRCKSHHGFGISSNPWCPDYWCLENPWQVEGNYPFPKTFPKKQGHRKQRKV